MERDGEMVPSKYETVQASSFTKTVVLQDEQKLTGSCKVLPQKCKKPNWFLNRF